MKCPICDTRKPRRHCLALNAEICSICCGNEREVSIACPLECPYLQEARRHEKLQEVNLDEVPNRDIDITEDFLRKHEFLFVFLGAKLFEISLATAGAVDSDVREALQSLIRTYRTLESGLYYETHSSNLIADDIHRQVQKAIDELRKELVEAHEPPLRDADILGVLVFMQRFELHQNNGRPRGRAFIDYLRASFALPEQPAQSLERAAPLIQL